MKFEFFAPTQIRPPLISTTLPFIYRLSSPNKKITTSATSSGVPILPHATFFSMLSTASFPAITIALVGVLIYPGATIFVLIPFGPSSSAMHFENPITPYLLAQYTAKPAVGLSPATDETFTNEAPDSRCGMQARVMLNMPFRLVVKRLS